MVRDVSRLFISASEVDDPAHQGWYAMTADPDVAAASAQRIWWVDEGAARGDRNFTNTCGEVRYRVREDRNSIHVLAMCISTTAIAK